jgi:Bacterial Ig-like domain (group 3)
VGVTSSLNPSVYGQAVSFTATVTGASPAGMVQFNIDGSAFGLPVTLASGSATSGTISTLSPATHTVTAVYSGNTNNAAGTGTLPGGQTVVDNAQVTASPSSISFGNVELCLTKTATVTLHDNASTLVQIGPISLINVTGNPSDFTIRSYSPHGILGPNKGHSYQIQVKFTPSEEASEGATLNIVTNAPGSPVQVPITGTGIANKKCD